MQILVVNCNTDAAMTARIAASARRAAHPSTDVRATEPSWGPRSAEGYYDSLITAAAVLDTLANAAGSFDGVVMAGYGEHGREGARQLLDVPVVDITEASAQLATLLSHRYGVVTTTSASVASIMDSLTLAGLMSRCSGIVASGLAVRDTVAGGPRMAEILVRHGRALLDGGADAIVLGCAGFAGLDTALEESLGVPVIDPVAAAVVMCESLVRLGKRTSKAGPYARLPVDRQYVDWPRAALAGPQSVPAEEAR